MAQACLRAEWEATQGEVCGLASHGERNRAETAATQASRVSNRKVDRKSLCLDSQRTTSWISKEVQPLAMISADATAHAAPNGIMTRKRQRALRAASDLAPGSCTDLETETEGSNNPVASQAADGCQDSQVQSLIPKHRPRGPPRGASMTAAAATDPVQPTLVVDAAAHAELPPSGGNVRAADARKRQRVLRAASDLAPGSRTDLETETEGSDNPGASQTADRQIDSQVQSLSHPNVTRATSMTTAAGPAQLADGRLDSLSAAVLSGQAEGTSTLVVDAAAPAAPSGNAGNMHATDARKRQRVLRAASDLAPGSDTEVETETEGSNNPVASQAADCCQDSQVQSLSAPHMARASSVTAAAATDPVQPTLVVDAAAHAAVPPPGNVRATDSRKRQRALRAASDLAPGSCTDVEMGVEGSNSLVASQAADCRQDSQRQSLSAPNMARAASMTAAAATDPVQPTLVADAAAHAAVPPPGNVRPTDSRKRQRALRAASDLAPGSCTDVEMGVEGSNSLVASQAADCRQDSQQQSLSTPNMARVASTAAAGTDPVQPTLVVLRKEESNSPVASQAARGRQNTHFGGEGSTPDGGKQQLSSKSGCRRSSGQPGKEFEWGGIHDSSCSDTPAHFGGGCHSTCCSKSGCIRSSRQPGTKFDCSAHGEGGIHDRSRSNRSSPTCRQQIGFASECCVEWASRGHANFGGCRCTCLNYCGPIRSACSQCERKCYGKHSSDPVFGRAASAFSMRE
ncbi:unnamed protein product [Effrenium voratum]|uniref:Uncharacterized protein n=1 Tax=Effrenium voratum TaxID=2562239 RepID=A0AA36NMM2_9DINO|nr:unnamed protein product [Effrenium voratum]